MENNDTHYCIIMKCIALSIRYHFVLEVSNVYSAMLIHLISLLQADEAGSLQGLGKKTKNKKQKPNLYFPASKSELPSSLTKFPSGIAYFPMYFFIFFSKNHTISCQGACRIAHFFHAGSGAGH